MPPLPQDAGGGTAAGAVRQGGERRQQAPSGVRHRHLGADRSEPPRRQRRQDAPAGFERALSRPMRLDAPPARTMPTGSPERDPVLPSVALFIAKGEFFKMNVSIAPLVCLLALLVPAAPAKKSPTRIRPRRPRRA